MREKQNHIFTIGLIFVILMTFAVTDVLAEAGLLRPQKNFDAVKPVFSAKTLWNGDLMQKYGDYVAKRFMRRSRWRNIYLDLEIINGRRDFNGVYIGKKGAYFEQHLPEDYTDGLIARSLTYLEVLTAKYNARVLLVPTAEAVWRNRRASNAPTFNQKAYLEQVRETLGEEVYIDACGMLCDHAEEEIYFLTDRHWTALGAYYGYLAWWEGSGKLLPYYYNTEKMACVTEEFRGSLYKKSGIEMRREKLKNFPETQKRSVDVLYDGYFPEKGYYRRPYLESDQPYGYFLGRGFKVARIETGYQKKQRLLIAGDDFANVMAPLLAPHYYEIVLVNLKEYTGDPVRLIDKEMQEGTEVLILWSVPDYLDSIRKLR